MKVCHILFCFIFLTAQEDGNSGRVSAEASIHKRVEGQDVTFECSFKIPGSTKFFYKGDCENGNILIKTTYDTFQKDRYSMKYVKEGFLKSDIMFVSITQLKKSDSGQYCCTLETSLTPDYFELIVTEASNTLTPDFTLKPVPTSTFLLSASTTTQSLNFSSGGCTPSSASTELVEHSETPAASGELLYVIPVLVVMIILLSAALLIFYKKKRKNIQPKGPPVEPEYADVNRPSSSPAVEMSTVYSFPKSCQQNRAKNLELYSLVSQSPQNKAEEEMNEVNYAVVDFSHIPATSSAPCGQTAEVIYSTPRTDASPAHHATDVSPPLYSTVTKQ